jgi:predicted nucleotide-binding protein
MNENNIELLNSALTKLSNLQYQDEDALDAFRQRTQMIIRNICTENSSYTVQFARISYKDYSTIWGEDGKIAWNKGVMKARNLLNTIKEEVVMVDKNIINNICSAPNNRRIFIVHGHDDGFKASVARKIEQLNFEPIILHEMPSKGQTIIEKFVDFADVGFAIVLLSADDVGRSKDDTEDKTRARQNVVFEFGFFLAKIGRERVVALYKKHEKFELPTDLSGVLYIEYDDREGWVVTLAKELKACGYKVNLNLLSP